MATYITINGAIVDFKESSLWVSNILEGRSTASFTVIDSTGTASYSRGQPIEIFTDSAFPPFLHPLFYGFIDYPERQQVTPSSSYLFWNIECMDSRYLAEKRIAAESYTGKTAGYIVDDLFDEYLAAEGVTIGSIEAGPVILEMVINYASVAKAFDILASRSNFIWRIDRDKRLWFTARTTVAAPFAVVESDILANDTPLLAEVSPKYRNRQYVRAGKDLTVLQTETRLGDGEAVAFIMGYPLAKVPTITVGGAGQSIGIKDIDTGKQVYWNKNDATITFTTAPGIGVAVVCAYYGFYDILIRVDSLAQQMARKAVEGGTGIVEALDDLPSIETKGDAFDAAMATLSHYGATGKQFSFPLDKWGLEPGQTVLITHQKYGLLADSFLVESVNISELGPDKLKYSIRAAEGPELGDWTGFFKSLVDAKSEIMDRLTVGLVEILIITSSTSENWERDESVSETVYACPIPSATLYPLSTLYPC